MEITKTAMIAITGRPNVGKSTLANTLAGEKVSIVTNKPQTTRNRIYAITNKDGIQYIFVDTPGYHKPRSKLGEYMLKVVRDSFPGMDCVILMVEPVANIGTQEAGLIEMIKHNHCPSVLLINKIDTVKKEDLLSVIELYSKAHEFDHIIPLCAKNGDGTTELLELLKNYTQDGSPLFPEDMSTDQSDSQIMSELVREKLLFCLDHEIPHGTAVEVSRFSQREETGIIDLEVTIYCEKQSHKSILIGKNGAMLKKIGELARKDAERYMGEKVFLQTWVKVRENWRASNSKVRNFGYGD